MTAGAANGHPGSYLVGNDGPVAIVPARIARLLERNLPALHDLRISLRGNDYEAYKVLDALHRAALAYRVSVTGNDDEPVHESARRSQWMNCKQAATHLNLGERMVRVEIARRRLPADKIDGRWRISLIDVENYRAQRTPKD